MKRQVWRGIRSHIKRGNYGSIPTHLPIGDNSPDHNVHYKLATFSRRQKPMCLLGENFQYGLLGEKGCNFIMILSSGEPQPIFSNVAFGPSALRQHWKILASAHHLIMLQYDICRRPKKSFLLSMSEQGGGADSAFFYHNLTSIIKSLTFLPSAAWSTPCQQP